MLRLRAAVIVTTGVLAVTSCAEVPASAPPPPDVGVEHVHGLGVDPADGVLYAATHFGLFRLPEDGEAERVADRYQDTMGFTVAGPGTFLGSGHPDLRMDAQLPTRLGLIRSENAGRSWEIVSLGGEADLHVLRLTQGSIYGWDAGTGRLLVSSDDGASWEVRSMLDLHDLVVHPADPSVLLAVTERGVQRSADGGRNWAPAPGTPAMAVLAWPTATSLYGITADGALHQSTDGGGSWTRRGTVDGEPEALVVDIRGGAERMYVALTTATILESVDGGVSFTVRYAD